MLRSHRLITTGMALAIAGTVSLTGCTQTKEAATATGEAAKEAATATAQAALAPAVNPVLDLLKKGQGEVAAGNVGAAATTIGGFKGLWEKAGPVIQPLAGDKWPAIETAANTLISTFAGGTPDAASATSAISGLTGPLSALVGK
jgi:hypothetical protein